MPIASLPQRCDVLQGWPYSELSVDSFDCSLDEPMDTQATNTRLSRQQNQPPLYLFLLIHPSVCLFLLLLFLSPSLDVTVINCTLPVPFSLLFLLPLSFSPATQLYPVASFLLVASSSGHACVYVFSFYSLAFSFSLLSALIVVSNSAATCVLLSPVFSLSLFSTCNVWHTPHKVKSEAVLTFSYSFRWSGHTSQAKWLTFFTTWDL